MTRDSRPPGFSEGLRLNRISPAPGYFCDSMQRCNSGINRIFYSDLASDVCLAGIQ